MSPNRYIFPGFVVCMVGVFAATVARRGMATGRLLEPRRLVWFILIIIAMAVLGWIWAWLTEDIAHYKIFHSKEEKEDEDNK